MVYIRVKQFEQAERAFQQALATWVQIKNPANEAKTLRELGNLYNATERLEEAAIFHQQALRIHVKLRNLNEEGGDRTNLANVLIKLQRYGEARSELHRAIECRQPYGYAAQTWKTWELLHQLEQLTGNQEAASQARQQAIATYAAYRRAGGENQEPGAQLAGLVYQAIQQRQTSEAEQALAQYLERVDQPWAKAMIPKLQAIVNGDRNPALTEDAALDYDDAAELILLLEALEEAEQQGNQDPASD